MKLGGIYISVQAKTDKLKRDLAKAKTLTQKTAVQMKHAISKINFAKVGVAAAAFTVAYVYGMKKAIDTASDLQEVQGKFDVVFKDHKEQAEDMAKVLVDSYAMSTREAKQYMSSIQDLLVPMGMMADKALLMSNEVVKLAADLGSFNNLPTATVMLDIQSALVGNFETMKKYGVVLNETVIKQKALEMGLWSGKGMVDANTKAHVAYTLMLKGSAAAIGDQERTMGSYANQLKKLKANVENIAATIGNELLPKVTEWVNQINTMIEKNPQLIKQMGELAKNSLDLASGLAKISFEGLLVLRQTIINLDKALGISSAVKSYKQLLMIQNKIFDSLRGRSGGNRISEDFDNIDASVVALISDTDQLGRASERLNLVFEKLNTFPDLNLGKIKTTEELNELIKQNSEITKFNMELKQLETDLYIESEVKKIEATKKTEAETAELMKRKVQNTVEFFNQMSNLMNTFATANATLSSKSGKQSRSDFERQKAFNYAQATMSTAAAVANALAKSPWSYTNAINAVAMGLLGTAQTINIATTKYAKGGAFTNGIVEHPTMFNNSVMGEAGPEAIMPLARGPSGELGVKTTGGNQPTQVTYIIQAIDSKSFLDTVRRNPDAITLVLNEQMQRGNSALNNNIRRVVQ